MDRAAIGAAPMTHSPYSSAGRIASTRRPPTGRECGYGKMDIHGGEGTAIITSFRTVRLCRMGGVFLRYEPITSVHQMEVKCQQFSP